MLFNSPEFIFLFLPLTLSIFFYMGGRGYRRVASVWLVAASLVFYGWWNRAYLGLLIFSILFNYWVGAALSQRFQIPINQKWLLTLGIVINLLLLGYFKYANFFVNTVNDILGTGFNFQKIILPLAISFFTFTQIAYIFDAYQGKAKKYNFLDYCLFVTFFPHLIAGPIVHHDELIPEFARKETYHFNIENIGVGLTIFSMGLFKKVIFADSIAVYANPVFEAASRGVSLTLFEAWVGILAYTLQLYFDFSGYSDMAIGASRMFGVKLPLNFDSPYKSVNISDFWRRWHITLSNFLRDYIYIPLGGNRKGEPRRYLNLMITMLLGGLWHGAGWTFVIWGGLHGVYLVINRQWQLFRRSLEPNLLLSSWWCLSLGRLITFLAVVVAWVFFRAENMKAVGIMLKGMVGANGVSLPPFLSGRLAFLQNWGIRFDSLMPNLEVNPWYALSGIFFLLLIAWCIPNTQQWMAQYSPALSQPTSKTLSDASDRFCKKLQWQPNIGFGMLLGVLLFLSVRTFLGATPSDFIYFNF